MSRRPARPWIIYYHRICDSWGFDISCSAFDLQLRMLKSIFDVVPLSDAVGYYEQGKAPKRPCVAITFDDGFLDTWVYAYPFLKKHRLRATLFVTTSRLIEADEARPTLMDYWEGTRAKTELYRTERIETSHGDFFNRGNRRGFLTIEELRRMKDSFDIGSHGHIHARVFAADRLVDIFEEPSDHWSLPFAYGERPRNGYPIFPSISNLAGRRGDVRREVLAAAAELSNTIPHDQNWRTYIKEKLRAGFTTMLEFESEYLYRRRIELELRYSKAFLQTMLGVTAPYFSYPFGQYDESLVATVGGLFSAGFITDKPGKRPARDRRLVPRHKMHRDSWTFLAHVFKSSC